MSERNEIERKAIAALKYLAGVIIFILDASETCGWSIDSQFNLYSEVRRTFPLTPTIVVFNKIDITPPEHLEAAKKRLPHVMEIVASRGDGVEELIRTAVKEIDLSSHEAPEHPVRTRE
jgi:nucleolar GTP-binding protein